MLSKLKIIHNKHTGRLRPHKHTSYIPLAFLVYVVGVILVGSTILSTSTASAGHPPPQSGSIGLTGTVPSAPPKLAATITSPNPGQHFSTSPITVSGSCTAADLVEIYTNDIFAGSTVCSANSTYSMQIDLLYGQNILTAQIYDDLNQAGPASNSVTVFYDASAPQSSSLSLLNLSGTQLVINTNAVYRGSFPGQTLSVPISVIGGTAPYAVNVLWGDSSNKIIPVADNSVFNVNHVYKKPGTFKLTIEATDSHGQVAYLTVAVIINGQPGLIGSTSTKPKPPLNIFLVLWPLYAIVVTLVVSFWMGEKREKKKLAKASSKGPPTLVNTPNLST